MADAFIPSTDFDGDDNHRPVPDIRLGRGRATFNGQIVFANISRKDAESLLPKYPELVLATNHGPYPNRHPILHLHGRQTQTSWVIDGQPYPVGNDYSEFMLLIPFVQLAGSTQWHNFAVRMYLGDVGAVTLGLDFGYRKRLAQVTITPQTCSVVTANPFNIFLWKEAFASSHSADSSAGAMLLPNWPEIRSILSMPILGIDEGTAIALCSYFLLDFTNATVAPITCTHDYMPAFEPSVPMGSMTSAVDGALDVAGVEWQIDFPAIPC